MRGNHERAPTARAKRLSAGQGVAGTRPRSAYRHAKFVGVHS